MYKLSIVRQSVIFHIIFDVVLVSYTCAVHISGRQVGLMLSGEWGHTLAGMISTFHSRGGKHIAVNFKV